MTTVILNLKGFVFIKNKGVMDVKLTKALSWMIFTGILFCSPININANLNDWEPITQIKVPEMSPGQQPINNAVGFYNQSFGIMVGNGGEAHYTMDGGKTWLRSECQSQGDRCGLEILNETMAWSCGDLSQVVTTDNGALNWQLVGTFGGGHNDSCRFLSFIDSRIGWIASFNKLGMTTDGGYHWVEIPLPKALKGITGIALQSENTGYIFDISDGGNLYRTNDCGKIWVKHRIGIKKKSYPVSIIDLNPLTAMRFNNNNQGLIVINIIGGLWEMITSDGGNHWRQGPVPGKNGSLFLAPDGKTLTICSFDNVITLLRRGAI